MQFFKKHFEKIILSVVLLGLTAVLAFIPVRLSSVQAELEDLTRFTKERTKNKYTSLPLTEYSSVLERLKNPPSLVFDNPHNLVSPVQWQKNVSGALTKNDTGDKLGAKAIQVKKIRPLFLKVELQKATESGGSFIIRREDKPPNPGEKDFVLRTFTAVGVKGKAPEWQANPPYWEGSKTIVFELKQIKGPAENPDAWIFSRSDAPEEVVEVTKDKPYEVVVGYTADLYYEPEKKPFLNYRVNDGLVVAGETNKVIDIKSNLVVLSSDNGKRTPLTPR